jgi:hypothetical protein
MEAVLFPDCTHDQASLRIAAAGAAVVLQRDCLRLQQRQGHPALLQARELH